MCNVSPRGDASVIISDVSALTLYGIITHDFTISTWICIKHEWTGGPELKSLTFLVCYQFDNLAVLSYLK